MGVSCHIGIIKKKHNGKETSYNFKVNCSWFKKKKTIVHLRLWSVFHGDN